MFELSFQFLGSIQYPHFFFKIQISIAFRKSAHDLSTLNAFQIENSNKRLLQLLRKTNAELILRANNSCHLSNDYQGLRKLKAAIKYHQRQLQIAKEVKDKDGEGKSYGNLANAYRSLGQFKTAIQYH